MNLTVETPREQDAKETLRRRTEGLLTYAEHLDSADRALVEAVFERGASAAGLARAMSRDPRHVRRRLKRLINRMSSRMFQFVLRQRMHWTPNQRRVAEAVVLRGLTQRQAASELGLTLHQVRTYMHAVYVLAHEANTETPKRRNAEMQLVRSQERRQVQQLS